MQNYKIKLKDISSKLAKEVKKVREPKNAAWVEKELAVITFKEWLSDNDYKPTNGTPMFPSGLTEFHEKESVLYNTVKLCIQFNDR
jgi:hypothetical protein